MPFLDGESWKNGSVFRCIRSWTLEVVHGRSCIPWRLWVDGWRRLGRDAESQARSNVFRFFQMSDVSKRRSKSSFGELRGYDLQYFGWAQSKDHGSQDRKLQNSSLPVGDQDRFLGNIGKCLIRHLNQEGSTRIGRDWTLSSVTCKILQWHTAKNSLCLEFL